MNVPTCYKRDCKLASSRNQYRKWRATIIESATRYLQVYFATFWCESSIKLNFLLSFSLVLYNWCFYVTRERNVCFQLSFEGIILESGRICTILQSKSSYVTIFSAFTVLHIKYCELCLVPFIVSISFKYQLSRLYVACQCCYNDLSLSQNVFLIIMFQLKPATTSTATGIIYYFYCNLCYRYFSYFDQVYCLALRYPCIC